MKRIEKNVLSFILKIGYAICSTFVPVKDKQILFLSFHGKGYSDSPKAIYEYMMESGEYKDYSFVWAIKNARKKNIGIPGAKIIEYGSISFYLALASSKYWFFNCKMPVFLKKKRKQVYLQTWHGTPLKRLGKDIIVPEGTTFYRSGSTEKEMHASYEIDSKKYNYMVSPNPFCTRIFPGAFGVAENKLIETGYPRNDILVNTTDAQIAQMKKEMGLPLDKKIILYAPTWRDNSFNNAGYTFELKVDFKKWQEVLGDEYVVIFKPHYLIVNKFDMSEVKDFVYEVGAEKDISAFYLLSDILVTDYSSVFFDYAILNRPMYFYMFDLKEYAEELRGFYFDIHETLPGDILEDENTLLMKIKDNAYDFERLDAFNEEFNPWSDGLSSKKILDHVFHKRG